MVRFCFEATDFSCNRVYVKDFSGFSHAAFARCFQKFSKRPFSTQHPSSPFRRSIWPEFGDSGGLAEHKSLQRNDAISGKAEVVP